MLLVVVGVENVLVEFHYTPTLGISGTIKTLVGTIHFPGFPIIISGKGLCPYPGLFTKVKEQVRMALKLSTVSAKAPQGIRKLGFKRVRSHQIVNKNDNSRYNHCMESKKEHTSSGRLGSVA